MPFLGVIYNNVCLMSIQAFFCTEACRGCAHANTPLSICLSIRSTSCIETSHVCTTAGFSRYDAALCICYIGRSCS